MFTLSDVRCRVGPVQVVSLAGDSVAAYFPLIKQVVLLSRPELEILLLCRDFLSLEEHAANLNRHVSHAGGVADIRELLCRHLSSGVLVTQSDLLRRAIAFQESSGDRVSWIVVPTYNRPESALLSIQSYLCNIHSHGRHVRLFISDQTGEGGEHGGSYRSKALSEGSGFEWFYSSATQKNIFIDAICSDGTIPRETMRFALFGCAKDGANVGANRNAALLQTLGTLVISVDDDTVCYTARAPGSSDAIKFCGEMDPSDVWFFGDRCGAFEFGTSTDLDFLRQHECLLGRRLDETLQLASAGGSISVGAACNHIIEHLFSGSGIILATYAGLSGDAGAHSAFQFLTHPSSDTRNRLRSSPEVYVRNRQSREVVRQALCATVTHGAGAAGLTTCVGLDNRDLLPPFFPSFCGEDGIFANMTSRSRVGSCFAHLPFTVRHDRRGLKPYGDVVDVRVADLIQGAIASCPLSVADTSAQRLQALGKFLSFVGTRDEGQFHDWLQSVVLARASSLGQVAQSALSRDRCLPDYWAEDIAQILEGILRSIQDPDHLVPEEVRHSGGLSAAKEIIRKFGELTSWWPAIVEKTKLMADIGVSVGVRLR